MLREVELIVLIQFLIAAVFDRLIPNLIGIVYVLEDRECGVFRVFPVSETVEAIFAWINDPEVDRDWYDVNEDANDHSPLTHDLRRRVVKH